MQALDDAVVAALTGKARLTHAELLDALNASGNGEAYQRLPYLIKSKRIVPTVVKGDNPPPTLYYSLPSAGATGASGAPGDIGAMRGAR